jgi:biopolymer transport protein ExbD
MMESKVNIIPLINVIFVILIFFLVLYRFSTFDVESKDEEKETETQELIKGESRIYDIMETVLVEVSVDGAVFIDGKEISNSVTDFKERIEAPKQTICILNINKDAPYYTFGKLIYNLKIVGVERISFLEKD